MIKVYIFKKDTGVYLYEDVGSIDGIFRDLRDDLDFTLTPYPTDNKRYYWNGAEWVLNELVDGSDLDLNKPFL